MTTNPWQELDIVTDVVSRLPILSTSKLTSEEEWRRAYVVLSFLTHGHIWGGNKPCEILPPSITTPYLRVSEHLDLPPVATYAALNLWNFSCCSGEEDFTDLDSLRAINTFSGTEDESWFYVLSAAVEARGASVIPPMLRAVGAIERDDHETVTKALRGLASCIQQLTRLLSRMDERCDPMVFYHQIRPFLAGTKNMESAGLPRGVFFDEGDGKGRWYQLRGGSNGQSSLVQFFDVILGIEHASTGSRSKTRTGGPLKGAGKGEMGFHEEVRLYMPGPHRRFLQAVSRMDSIKEYVLSSSTSTSPERAELRRAYRDAASALGDFRSGHMQMVTRYIIVPSRRSAALHPITTPSDNDNLVNLATASSSRSGNAEELTGTGGTALIPFLRTIRDETYEAAGR